MACICKINIFLAGLLKMKPNENLSHLTETKSEKVSWDRDKLNNQTTQK